MAEFTFTPEFIERTEPTFSPEFAEYAELHHGVVSVNNKQGVVVLYGSDICTSPTDSTTLDQKIDNSVNDIEYQLALRVAGPDSSVDSHIAIFDGTTGKVVKDSGFTIQKSMTNNAASIPSSAAIITYITNNIATIAEIDALFA